MIEAKCGKKMIKIRNVLPFLILLLVITLALSSTVQAKVFVIQNESVNMLIVTASSGNIILNPSFEGVMFL